MITNLNARRLGNGAIVVSWQEDGKAHDAGFLSWEEFAKWLSTKIMGT